MRHKLIEQFYNKYCGSLKPLWCRLSRKGCSTKNPYSSIGPKLVFVFSFLSIKLFLFFKFGFIDDHY